MLSELYTSESEDRDEREVKCEGEKKLSDRLDGWLLSPQQRSFLEPLFDERN